MSRCSDRSLVGALALALLGVTVLPAALLAQDLFGREVAVAGDQVIVTKPLVGVGPATAYVFGWADGWDVQARLRPQGANESGESFGPALSVAGHHLLLGSGDPELRESAHLFRLDGADWTGQGTAPLDPSQPPAPAGDVEVTMATVMAILQPPARVVAGYGDRIAVGVVGSTDPAGAPVRVLTRSGDAWSLEAEIRPEGATARDRLGAALVLTGDWLFVGAPGQGASGSVHVYRHAGQGIWDAVQVLAPTEGAESGSGFGSALWSDGSALFVGAPGSTNVAGRVHAFALSAEGWSAASDVRAPEPVAGDRFGGALAADGGEIWIGAPGADGGRGAVHVLTWDATAGTLALHSTLEPVGREPGFAFGAAVAVQGSVGVVGAPFAHGGTGAAAAFRRAGDGWDTGTWLSRGDGLQTVTGTQIDCGEEGQAAGFDCDDVDLLAFLPLAAIGAQPGERVSDLWGWTDPASGREYALVGRTAGLALVDVTNANEPRYLGLVPANPSGARDVKVYQDHAFFTGDGAGEHGLVVFDLRRLREAGPEPTEFEPDARYTGIASAHNLVLDPESGFAYPVGASGGGETCGGGLHMVDVRDPLNPTFAGCFTDTEGLIWVGRTHDAQCVVYRGPDERYEGREICFVSNETAVRIVDVTDKENPVPLGAGSYPGVAYVHQGWLTDDHRYFYLNDELDELVGTTERTRTLIWDVSELDDPVMVGDHLGANGATDHNLYVKGDRMYQANYQAGFRVFDISDPLAPEEIGFFDTTPYEGDPPGFVGAWTAFPYFESGTVIVSSMNEGLFLVKPKREPIP